MSAKLKKMHWKELSIKLSDSGWYSDSCIEELRDLEERKGRDAVIKELSDYNIIFI